MTVSDAARADALLSDLMGSAVGPRRALIDQYAAGLDAGTALAELDI